MVAGSKPCFQRLVFSGAVSQSDVQPSTAKDSQPFKVGVGVGGHLDRWLYTSALLFPKTPMRSFEGWGAVYAQLHPPIS